MIDISEWYQIYNEEQIIYASLFMLLCLFFFHWFYAPELNKWDHILSNSNEVDSQDATLRTCRTENLQKSLNDSLCNIRDFTVRTEISGV